ncbi:sperm-associated antigen 17 isoform X4 [Nerophis ophidion]|uniref:sperm-associated antigen 17 isoform X4 n=1 Tax=Nerophis ophidion TaxID=159077 RepID=UPI002AE09FD6|nr:sperm-associated antigen 17 isoform X4 [Nerophis ophidion]
MAPKAAKKDKAKKPPAAQGPEAQSWESGLANAQFEEEQWRACVCFMVGRSPHDEDLIPTLLRAVQPPQRKLFSALTWEHTAAKIIEYGNPKAKKREHFPQFYEVTERAKVLLDAKEEIPTQLMAQIVKFMFLQIKESDHQRRKAKQADETAVTTKDKAGPKGKGKGKDKKPKEEPPPTSKTKLKRRDEVEPPKYIDDEPVDGPQHYILLLGFHQPQLIGALDAAGVRVSNVISLSSPPPPQQPAGYEEEDEEEISEADAKLEDTAAKEKWDAQAKVLDHFWSGLRQVLDNAAGNSQLHNVAQLEYTVPDVLITFDPEDPEAVMGTATQMFEGVANLIYDCLDWRRQHQHYIDTTHFLAVPTVVTVDRSLPPEPPPTLSPQSKKSGRPPPPKKAALSLTTDVDMHHYSSLLDHVPAEACSVPLILHCMLEQVVLTSEQFLQPLVSDESGPQNVPPLDHELVGQMLNTILPRVHADEERKHLLQSLLTTVNREEDKEIIKEKFDKEETPKKPEQPVIIRHHDERALRLFGVNGVQGFDPPQVEASMMRWSPVWNLIDSVAHRQKSSCWRAIKQQLQHQCTDEEVSWPQVERFFHQSVFESMWLTGLDENGVLRKDSGALSMLDTVQNHPLNPWDNPLSFAKKTLRKKCPKFVHEDCATTKVSEQRESQLSLADIQSCRLRSLLDWHYVEHYDAAILPQVLQSAAQRYRCVDTLKGSHNNVMYIFCHNPISPNRMCTEFWNVDLHTDVKFRIYLEHVANTITEWTEKEDLKRHRVKINRVSTTESSESSAEDEAESKETFITKDSIKASLLEEEKQKEEEPKKGKKPGKAAPAKGKKQTDEAKSKDSKKSDKSAATAKKSKAEKDSISSLTSDLSFSSRPDLKDEPSTGFTGFHMDGMLIHLLGQLQYLFPSDGGHITVETINYVEGSSMLKVAVRKDDHHFYTHISHVVQTAKSEVKDATPTEHPVKMTAVKWRSFSALLDNGVHLSYSFYGPTGEYKESHKETEIEPQKAMEPVEDLNPSVEETPNIDNDPSEVCEGQSQESLIAFKSLNLSLPCGLLLQFLRDEEDPSMLVRLSFHTPGHQDPSLAKEASRIVTSHGAVIRYMKDGSSEVLEDGQVTVHNVGPAPGMLPEEEEEEEEEEEKEGEDTEISMCHGKPRGNYPRLFLVHEDGSGSELLNSQTVVELLDQAHLDPTVALLKDPLPDTQDEFGITFLKPSNESMRSKWVQEKQDLNVMLQNFRNRSSHEFPSVEFQKSSSPSGTTTVRGLTLGNWVGRSSVAIVAMQSCPKVLEIREICQHRAITRRFKNIMDMRLKGYIESLMEKAQWSADVMLKDPRSEEERVHAGVLLTQSLIEIKDEHTLENRTPGDIGNLYSQAMQAPAEVLDDSEDLAIAPSASCEVKETKWTDRLEQHRQELFEVKYCVDALKKKLIVPYFHPENVSVHQNLLHLGSPDITRPIFETFPRPDDTMEAFNFDVLQHYTPQPSISTQTHSAIPTPTHSASRAAVRSRTPAMRPQTAGHSSRTDYCSPLRSAQVNVIGEPRRTIVRLPPTIVSSKPYSVPNYHFHSVEEPVRRRCRTISLAGPGAVMRGFELRPSSVDFGTQKEGTSSAITVVMKNVGVDTCRFHIIQPPTSSGLRVKYHPGPVPAGLHIELQIELFAMCQVQEGNMDPRKYIFQDIVIRTETDILYLPVMAIILPEGLYDIWLKDHSSPSSRKHLRQPKQSSSLPAAQGLGQTSPSGRGVGAAAHTGHHKGNASL